MPEEPRRTLGEALEGVAFTFCKAATVILLAQKFALPVAAGLSALFYLLAYLNGKKDTRCVLGHPLVIVVFWGVIAAFSLTRILGAS